MIKLRVVRKRAAKFPSGIKFDIATLSDLGKIVAGGVLDNIKSQHQADGATLKHNAPSTRERKRRMGLPLLSLVFTKHRFVKGQGASWAINPNQSANKVSVKPATIELQTISRAVQGMGYTGWFGVTRRAREALRERVRRFLREKIRAAQARR